MDRLRRSSTDFKQDAFVSQLWLVDTASGRSFQLTRSEKSVMTRSGHPTPNGSHLRAIARVTRIRSSPFDQTAVKPR
jgi:hypothetical protein